jgi:hypothetical protein
MWISAIAGMLVFHGVFYGISWLVGRAVFAPLYQRTLLFEPSARFRISDVMVLAFYVQVISAVGISFSSPHDRYSGPVFFLCGELIAIALFCWLNGLRMLGRGGVQDTWYRWWFLGLVLPVGYVGGLFSIASIFVVPAACIALSSPRSSAALSTILLFSGSWVAVYCAYRSSRFIACQARNKRAEKDGVHFIRETSTSRFRNSDLASDDSKLIEFLE